MKVLRNYHGFSTLENYLHSCKRGELTVRKNIRTHLILDHSSFLKITDGRGPFIPCFFQGSIVRVANPRLSFEEKLATRSRLMSRGPLTPVLRVSGDETNSGAMRTSSKINMIDFCTQFPYRGAAAPRAFELS